MQNTGYPSWTLEVMEIAVFRSWKPMKARNLAGRRRSAACFFD